MGKHLISVAGIMQGVRGWLAIGFSDGSALSIPMDISMEPKDVAEKLRGAAEFLMDPRNEPEVGDEEDDGDRVQEVCEDVQEDGGAAESS